MRKLKELINIIHVVESNEIGGAQKVVFDICKSIRTEKCVCHILIINKYDAQHRMAQRFRESGINLIEINFYVLRKILPSRLCVFVEPVWIILNLIRIVLQYRLKIVHIHFVKISSLLPLLTTLSILNIPFIWTLHGEMNYLTESRVSVKSFLKRIRTKGRSFEIVQVNDGNNFELKDELCELGIYPLTIPNGVDIEKYIFSQTARNEIRKRLNISESCFLIGSVGRLEFEKGYDILVNAFSQFAKTYDTRLVLIGDGALMDEINMLIDSYGLKDKAELLGVKENIVDWLSAFDIYVQPSRSEGLPLALLEAMAIGLPIIATNVGGIPIALENGMAGMLISQESVNELANAILLLSKDKDLRQSYSAQALLRSRDFSVKKMSNSYQELYFSLI